MSSVNGGIPKHDLWAENPPQWADEKVGFAEKTVETQQEAETIPRNEEDIVDFDVIDQSYVMYDDEDEQSKVDVSTYVKNVGKGLYGYNTFYGMPFSADHAGTDPGFVHRSLWDATYVEGNVITFKNFTGIPRPTPLSLLEVNGTKVEVEEDIPALAAGPSLLETKGVKVPDGWKVTMGEHALCETTFAGKTTKSEFDYSREATESFNMFPGGRLDLGVVSFTYSSESKEFRANNAVSKQQLVTSSAECLVYILEMKDQDKPPPPSANFAYVASEVGSDGDLESNFYSLFEQYGLYYPVRVLFGARYGFSSYVDHQNYEIIKENSATKKVGMEITYQVGGVKGIGIEVTVGIEQKTKTGTKSTESSTKNINQVKEFSIGKRIPDEGGVDAWLKEVGDEPMPTRMNLASICDHPSLKVHKSDCEKYHSSYCKEYLLKIDNTVNCIPPPEPECLWDVDCGPAGVADGEWKCNDDGECEALPACTASIFTNDNAGGDTLLLGPTFRKQNAAGKVFRLNGWWEDRISSLTYSGGCEEVLVMDEDGCRESYSDNLKKSNRDNNFAWRIDDLPYDLDNDVCGIKLTAKKDWVRASPGIKTAAQIEQEQAGYKPITAGGCKDGDGGWTSGYIFPDKVLNAGDCAKKAASSGRCMDAESIVIEDVSGLKSCSCNQGTTVGSAGKHKKMCKLNHKITQEDVNYNGNAPQVTYVPIKTQSCSLGDGNGYKEILVSGGVSSSRECVAKSVMDDRCNGANGITIQQGANAKRCYCKFGMSGGSGGGWENCRLNRQIAAADKVWADGQKAR